MPRKGENIRKRKDGRWEGRYYVSDENTGIKKAKSVYARSYGETKSKLAEAKYQSRKMLIFSDADKPQKECELTFGDAAAAWLEKVHGEKKYSTYIKYHSIYKNHVQIGISHMRLTDLESEQIKKVVAVNGQVSSSLRKSIYSVINQIYEYAGEYYQIHPIKLTSKKESSNVRPVEVLNKAEQTQFLRFLYENMDINKFGILLCLSTGLRLGEICSLKWSDIDLRERVLCVNRTVQRLAVQGGSSKTILVEGAPKSIFSKREIPLSDAIIMAMSQFYRDTGYVISKDRPTEPRTYQNRFQKYLSQANLDKTNFHVLRHTFATNCINTGTDIKSLSEMLGHSSVNITLNRYVHPTMDTKRQHLNSLSAFYGQYMGQESS